MPAGLVSIKDRLLQLTGTNALVSNDIQVTSPCVDATITVGDEVTNARAITIQLKDSNGNDLAERATVRAYVMADASGDAFATTGGSTGIAIGTDGALLALVAKKAFVLISEADGDIDLTLTDTGTEVMYLHLELPNGRRVVSSALTNA
jgi:hypothetical protein